MAKLLYATNKNSSLKGKPRVYFTSHPDDLALYFDRIAADILKIQDCAIYYAADPHKVSDAETKENDLSGMNLFVVPVTFRLLCDANDKVKDELLWAKEKNLPILPLMMESGLDALYARSALFGERQYLSPSGEDATALSYEGKLKKYLDVAGLEYKVNPRIVRGLDYYTKTVFEFVTTSLGAQGTVCGGGRYDKLIEQIGGSSVPGVGFGMGLERVLMLMEAQGVEIPKNDNVKVYIASMGEDANYKAFELCYALRKLGVSAETDHASRSFKSQFKYADKIGAEYVIALGDNELSSGVCKVKKMLDGSEIEISISSVCDFFKE